MKESAGRTGNHGGSIDQRGARRRQDVLVHAQTVRPQLAGRGIVAIRQRHAAQGRLAEEDQVHHHAAAQAFTSGSIPGGFAQHIQLNKNPDASVTPWGLQLQVQGDTQYLQQRLLLQPGGYSGWHSHPGLLIATVKSGQIDLYDAACRKRTVTVGEVYSENDSVHGIINTGSVNAELYLTYLVKQGLPRRQEEDAPACAPETGIA